MDLAWIFREHAVAIVAAVSLAGWIYTAARAHLRTHGLLRALAQLERQATQRQEALEAGARRQNHIAQGVAKDVEQTLRELPEIAHRLMSCQEVRQIPDLALELLDEVFRPRYSIFFRVGRGELIAVAVRGKTEFRTGQRIPGGKGVVAWTALKQMVLTPEDADQETPLHRAQHLESGVFDDFQLCIPMIQADHTLGVVVIGPSDRNLPYSREIARTLGSLTSATLHSAKLIRQQETLARRDGLTGLLNKVNIRAQLDSALSSDPPPRQLSVFLFDIDHFKHYNDHNGHLAGDDLLKELGDMLGGMVREGEFVGRYGGEEFLVVLPGAAKDEALRAAERIRCRVAGHPFAFCEHQPMSRITVSGGVASFPMDSSDSEKLLKLADQALYEAKRDGRDRVHAYTTEQLTLEDPAQGGPSSEDEVDADLGEPYPGRPDAEADG